MAIHPFWTYIDNPPATQSEDPQLGSLWEIVGHQQSQ